MDILELANNIEKVKNNIKAVCENCGRENDVLLVGASKTMEQEVIDYVDSNRLLQVLGENKVQELTLKYRDNQSFDWHFIGRLQKNKVKYIIDKVKLIHSVDSVKLADEIDRRCQASGRKMDILIEVNIGNEENKSGVPTDEVSRLAEHCLSLPNIILKGFMAIPPIDIDGSSCKFFERMERIYNDYRCKFGEQIDTLSMGMSADYANAVMYGANIVRIGSALFGRRS